MTLLIIATVILTLIITTTIIHQYQEKQIITAIKNLNNSYKLSELCRTLMCLTNINNATFLYQPCVV